MVELIAIDTVDGTVVLPRAAAQALASGGHLSADLTTVEGGDPNYPGLPAHARELTDDEMADVRIGMLRSKEADTAPGWWKAAGIDVSLIDILLALAAVALVVAAIGLIGVMIFKLFVWPPS